MTDTFRFDDTEKIDILLKTSFGVPSTSEIKPWFQEDTIKFNPYLNGEHVFVDEIPKIPNFSNGTVRTATELNINSNNFIDYKDDPQDIDNCSIVDDETGIIRRYRFLILKETPQLGQNIGGSWYQTDNNNNNILTDILQFNVNTYFDTNTNVNVLPYNYSVFTKKILEENGVNLSNVNNINNLPFGTPGGNWFVNTSSGILVFPDFDNFSNGTQTTTKYQVNNQTGSNANPPVLYIYKYVGRKGIAKQISVVQNKTTITNPENNQIAVQTSDNTLHRYDTSTTSWISIGGSGGGSSGGGSTTIASLSDVGDVSYPSGANNITNGYVLKWNNTTSKWEPSADAQITSLSDVNDVTYPSGGITTGYVLKWNGTAWIPSPDAQGTGSGGNILQPSTGILNNFTEAQVLEKMTSLINSGTVKNSSGQIKTLSSSEKSTIPFSSDDSGDNWHVLNIFEDGIGIKPPSGTKQVKLSYTAYLSFNNDKEIFDKDALLEWIWVINGTKIINSKNIVHLDLIEKYSTIETTITIDETLQNDDLANNKLKTWTDEKEIKIYARSKDETQLVKIHKQKPSIDITSIGKGSSITSLNNIPDVSFNINDLSEGNILMWSETTNKWEAKENQGGSGNGVTVIPSSASVDLSENILYPTANTGSGKEGDIIYDASENLFYEASNSKTDTTGNGEIAFRPLGYSFFAKNMEGQAPNIQSTSFFFFELTPSSIVLHWRNPFQYETGITASPSQPLNETSPIVSQPSGDVGGKINFPVVNRIMMQIKNIETNQYITWGSKRSPISKYVTGLTGGYVICSKDYPIPPMSINKNFGNILSDGGRSNSIYKMQDFAESIILFSAGNTPTNNIIKSGVASYPKRIFPVSGENDKELESSEQGYEIKFWYENEYKKNPNSTFEDGWGMNENDFNVITLNQAKDQSGNLILDNGKINFLTVLPPTQPQEAISSIAFNNLGNVSNSNTLIEIKLKDPLKTTDTDIQYNSTINLVQIKFEYRNSATSGTDDNWNNVRKIFDKNAGLTSNNYSIANKGEQGSKVTLDNGIYMINRKVDEQYRYFYVEVNNDMLGLTNYNIEKYLSFRISYKNASTDEFGGETISNYIIFDRPNKPTISQVKMTSYNTFTITLASFDDREDIIGDTTSISNNNMGVFLRNINFNVAYQYSDQLSQSNITTFTEIEGGENSKTTSTNTSVHVNTTSFGQSTYTYTLPAGFYPNGSTNTNPITYYFSASVQNNLIEDYSEVSDQKPIQITKPNSSMTITLTPQTSLTSSSNYYNNKILATFTAPSNGNRGIESTQANPGLPKLQKYTFQSTNLKNVDIDSAVEHTNTSNTSSRNADPSTQKMFTFYDSLKGTTGSVTKPLDLAIREYNEYVNDHTDVTTNMSATATKPDLVTISSHTNLVISNTTSKNTVTLNWNLPDNKRGLTINNVKIRNTILTYRINIERAATTNKFIDNNSNHIDTTYETFTTRTDNSNDKTGTVDADNTKTLTSSNDGSLLWPNSTYNYTVRATNSLGYESDAQTTKGTFATGTPGKPSSINYFTNSRLNTLHNNVRTDFKDFQNYQYLGIKIYGRTSSSVAVQITEVDTTSYPSSFPKIYSNTITHVLNKTNLQNFLTNTEVQSWSNNVPNNANQACFKVINEADNNNEYYSLGASNEYGNEHYYGGEVGLDFFSMTRQNRKDIYSDTYDNRNRGYWLQESIQYTIDIGNGINQIINKPNKFVLQSFYNENGNDSLIEKDTPTGTTVICHNSYSTNNDYVYFDVLSSLPSISKLNSNPFINYTVNNYINGVPNVARLSNTYNKLSLTYIIKKYSALYYLDKTVNIFYHTINNANTNGTIGQVSWATFGSNTPYSYTNGKITTLRGSVGDEDDSYWQINNYEFDFTTTCSSSRADLQLTIHANNTKGHSSYLVNEGVCKFIYDKNSVDLINQSGINIMEVPSSFNPDFNQTYAKTALTGTMSNFSSTGNSTNNNQLNLWNGYFYSRNGWQNATSIITQNCANYGMSNTLPVFNGQDSDFKYVIFKYTRTMPDGNANRIICALKGSSSSNDPEVNISDLLNDNVSVFLYTGTAMSGHYWLNISKGNTALTLADAYNQAITYVGNLGDGIYTSGSKGINNSTFINSSGLSNTFTNSSALGGSMPRRVIGAYINRLDFSAGNILTFYIAIKIKNNINKKVEKPDLWLSGENTSGKTYKFS